MSAANLCCSNPIIQKLSQACFDGGFSERKISSSGEGDFCSALALHLQQQHYMLSLQERKSLFSKAGDKKFGIRAVPLMGLPHKLSSDNECAGGNVHARD